MKRTTPQAGVGRRGDGAKEQFWRLTLRQFAASGQSVRAFCATRQLSEPSFYSWRRALAERDAASLPTARTTVAPAFLPVQVTEATRQPIEIVLRGHRRIRLCGPVDQQMLARIVATLESIAESEG